MEGFKYIYNQDFLFSIIPNHFNGLTDDKIYIKINIINISLIYFTNLTTINPGVQLISVFLNNTDSSWVITPIVEMCSSKHNNLC